MHRYRQVKNNVEKKLVAKRQICIAGYLIKNSISASKILKSMNLKINPCDNFYDFVCGNYGKTVALSDSHLYSIPIHASMLEVDLRQQSIIEDINPSSAPEPFLHLRISYDNCMRESKWCHYFLFVFALFCLFLSKRSFQNLDHRTLGSLFSSPLLT